MPIRVLIVDDAPEVRRGLWVLVSQQPGMVAVGTAPDADAAMALIEAEPVDVVVMDVSLPEPTGIAATARIIAAFPTVRVIILSMQADRRYVEESLRAGASGYVLKECAYEELPEALEAVAAGGQYLSPEIEIGIP
jgi:DNA-binding NarL/FixJ family response regulator